MTDYWYLSRSRRSSAMGGEDVDKPNVCVAWLGPVS